MSNVSIKIYNFVDCSRIIFYCSMFICVISCIIVTIRGFNWGLDFTGGVLVEVVADQRLDIIEIRNSLIREGFKNVIIQYFDNSQHMIVRIPFLQKKDYCNQQMKFKLLSILKNNITHSFSIQRMNWIDPNTGENLIETVFISVLVALICIFLYIAYRFELKSSISTTISLIHDIIIIFGILSVCSIEINLTIIVALISSISYSLNDKIIIFDRIRENFNYMPQSCSFKVFNVSISQVLVRTIITSVTTMMVLLSLLVFGGIMLYEFSIILLLGIILGTMSSIYIASFIALQLKIEHKNFI